jgi:hypothetical protein
MARPARVAVSFLATGFLAAAIAWSQTHRPPATAPPADKSPAKASAAAKAPADAQAFTDDLAVWPNKVSKANSDVWLIHNHDKLRKMYPRVLVLNFCNGFEPEKAEKMAKKLAAAVTEGTRYHGYKDEKAEPFIEWQIAKIVDLRDADPKTPTPDGNSTKYPRSLKKDGPNFAYKELYSHKFARYYGFKDPRNPARYLNLRELVAQGLVHELWFFAYQREAGAPFECTEWMPVYDENFKRQGNEHRHAGNGGDPDEPWYGRSLRISFINAERGIGCNVESLSHAMEGMAHSSVIPYYRKYFYEFAGFDLDKRWKLPWDSLYAVGGEGSGVSYPDDHTAVIKLQGKEYRVDNYYTVGGNVHWTPNGRGQYDLDSPFPVLSTIEHYRLGDGPDGKDLKEPWTIEKFAKYKDMAPDCMGSWLIYWRQNIPGYGNKCKDDDGRPMKNWWPFLFY